MCTDERDATLCAAVDVEACAAVWRGEGGSVATVRRGVGRAVARGVGCGVECGVGRGVEGGAAVLVGVWVPPMQHVTLPGKRLHLQQQYTHLI